MLTDGRTDGLTDGRTDRRTDGQKIGRLYRTLLRAGAIKIIVDYRVIEYDVISNGESSRAILVFSSGYHKIFYDSVVNICIIFNKGDTQTENKMCFWIYVCFICDCVNVYVYNNDYHLHCVKWNVQIQIILHTCKVSSRAQLFKANDVVS